MLFHSVPHKTKSKHQSVLLEIINAWCDARLDANYAALGLLRTAWSLILPHRRHENLYNAQTLTFSCCRERAGAMPRPLRYAYPASRST